MKRYTYRSVTRRGRKDGRDWKWKFWPLKVEKHREPKSDQEIPAQYETEILQMGMSNISEIAEEWKELDKKLKPEYCKALAAYDHANQRYKKEAGEEKQASGEFDIARKKYEEVSPPRSCTRVEAVLAHRARSGRISHQRNDLPDSRTGSAGDLFVLGTYMYRYSSRRTLVRPWLATGYAG